MEVCGVLISIESNADGFMHAASGLAMMRVKVDWQPGEMEVGLYWWLEYRRTSIEVETIHIYCAEMSPAPATKAKIRDNILKGGKAHSAQRPG
jgi:hypothetical protein